MSQSFAVPCAQSDGKVVTKLSTNCTYNTLISLGVSSLKELVLVRIENSNHYEINETSPPKSIIKKKFPSAN